MERMAKTNYHCDFVAPISNLSLETPMRAPLSATLHARGGRRRTTQNAGPITDLQTASESRLP